MMNTLDRTAGDAGRQLAIFRVQTQCYAIAIESAADITLLRELNPIVGEPS